MNLFKRTVKILENAIITPELPVYTVKDIHNEFDSVEDTLLLEADSLLLSLMSKADTDLDAKAKQLEKLGFLKSSSVKEARELNTKVALTKEQASLIREYKQNYPFQKFLTEEELDRICQKYGLIYAPVGNYIGDVPQKNLNEITNAKNLDRFLLPKNDRFVKIDCSSSDVDNIELMSIIKNPIKATFDLPRQYADETTMMEFVRTIGYNGPRLKYPTLIKLEVTEISKEGLFIAAPEKDFDLTDISKKSKYGYFKSDVTLIIQDPIVFRYCKGGVQVLSKWGEEASDELVVNPIEN